MENQQINLAFDKAEELLSTAQNELLRPEEDVVTYMVYEKAKRATSQFLISFLTHYGIEVSSIDPEVLLNHCREINNNFYELNINPLIKTGKGDDAWISIQAARSFVTAAENVRSMVLREIN